MTCKAKQELKKKMQIPMYTSGKRQYLYKMQMLEINWKRQEAQVELKKSLRREARIIKEKTRDNTAKKILDSMPRDDDGDFLTMLPDETLNPSSRNSQNAGFLEHHSRNEYGPRKIGKMETWLHEQEAWGQLLWDSSSSDSDEYGKVMKKPRAPGEDQDRENPTF